MEPLDAVGLTPMESAPDTSFIVTPISSRLQKSPERADDILSTSEGALSDDVTDAIRGLNFSSPPSSDEDDFTPKVISSMFFPPLSFLHWWKPSDYSC
jgi:hypothetical protein